MARAAITKNVMLLHQVLMMENDKRREHYAFKAGAGTDEASIGAGSHEHAVPINRCKTDDAKNRASEEKARDMVRHAMANWSRWMRSC